MGVKYFICLNLLILLVNSCILKNIQEVEIIIPDAEFCREIADKTCFELKYYSEGRTNVITGIEPGSSLKIEIEKDIVPFTAYPIIYEYGITLKPAGALFPENYDGNVIEMSWLNGFASEAVLKLSEKGITFTNFNIKRFEDVLDKKSDGNPWRISDAVLYYSLSAGIFNSNHVTLRQSYDFELSNDFMTGNWTLADALDQRVIKNSTGLIQFENMYTGNYLLISEDTVRTAELFVTNDGWIVFFSGGEGGLSGNF